MATYLAVPHVEPYIRSYSPGNVGSVGSWNDYSLIYNKRHNVGTSYQDIARVNGTSSKLWNKATIQNATPFGYLFQMASNGCLDKNDYSQIPKTGAVPQIYPGNPENNWGPDNPSEPGKTIQPITDLVNDLHGAFKEAHPEADVNLLHQRIINRFQDQHYQELMSRHTPRRAVLNAALGRPIDKLAPRERKVKYTPPPAEQTRPVESNPLQTARNPAVNDYIVGQDARYRLPTGGSATGSVPEGNGACIVNASGFMPSVVPYTTQAQLPIPPNKNAILNQTTITRYDNNYTSDWMGTYRRPSDQQQAPTPALPNTGNISAYNESISGVNTRQVPTDIQWGVPIATPFNPPA